MAYTLGVTLKKRRAYGTGSVWQRSDGRWYGVIEAGYTAKGGRRRITVSAKTEAEAKRRLKEKQRQVSAEGVTDASGRTTVKAWSADWLQMTQRTLRPKPWATDASAVRKWIVPTIGHRRLDQLTPADVRKVSDAQRAAGRSTSTSHRTHVTLLAMLRSARQEGHQIPGRVLEVKAPALAVSDRTDMPIPAALAILHEASFLPHGSRWAMAFLHGMRQGECLGLTWDRVDLDAGLVVVDWQQQALPYAHGCRGGACGKKPAACPDRVYRVPDGHESRHLDGAYHLTRPKSKAGFRVVPLVPAMREALADWRSVAPESPWGLVWPAADGTPANEKEDREEFYALQLGTQRTADLSRLHPSGRYYFVHEARHTTATQMLEKGVDPHLVTAIMGHSSILTSRGYQHPSQVPALAAMEAIASGFELG